MVSNGVSGHTLQGYLLVGCLNEAGCVHDSQAKPTG